jgi:hypothetical protein
LGNIDVAVAEAFWLTRPAKKDGVIGGSVTTTRMCQVPFLTNTIELEEGEELFLEVLDKSTVKKEPQKRTWRNAFIDQEKQQKQKDEAAAQNEKQVRDAGYDGT